MLPFQKYCDYHIVMDAGKANINWLWNMLNVVLINCSTIYKWHHITIFAACVYNSSCSESNYHDINDSGSELGPQEPEQA